VAGREGDARDEVLDILRARLGVTTDSGVVTPMMVEAGLWAVRWRPDTTPPYPRAEVEANLIAALEALDADGGPVAQFIPGETDQQWVMRHFTQHADELR
jgi:hypothetical protein